MVRFFLKLKLFCGFSWQFKFKLLVVNENILITVLPVEGDLDMSDIIRGNRTASPPELPDYRLYTGLRTKKLDKI